MTRSIDTEIKRVTVTLPKWQLDALDAIATREGVSVAWWCVKQWTTFCAKVQRFLSQ